MKYVECPENFAGDGRSLFIAGGITGCENWQEKLVELLKNENLVLLNPRRKKFPDYLGIEEEQIKWEHEHMKKASAISFWFTRETVCPITLYELGKLSSSDKKVFVGIDPEYSRKIDVKIQTNLARPDIRVVYSLEELSEQIKQWLNEKFKKEAK